jgi:uncharacterized damage-inducible protein DinB
MNAADERVYYAGRSPFSDPQGYAHLFDPLPRDPAALACIVQEALEFFAPHPKIARILQTLYDVGLEYIKLGQSALTLSGGEAQRVKLAKELSRVAVGNTVYFLDERTTRLHFADIQRLLDVLHRLVDSGKTVIVIEHNLDVIDAADYIIDLGPEGGDEGGYIVAQVTPEQVVQEPVSYTGQFLADLMLEVDSKKENQMTHPLVTQLRFARSEFQRCLEGLSDEDARTRLAPMNCISWMIGHLANQEHFYWVFLAQEKAVAPGLNDLVGFGKPASTPPLDEMWQTWQLVTTAADPFLDTLTTVQLDTFFQLRGKAMRESVGTMMLRNIYHYWFHTGEAHAVRQQLGHTDLPQFVGNMAAAVYRPE